MFNNSPFQVIFLTTPTESSRNRYRILQAEDTSFINYLVTTAVTSEPNVVQIDAVWLEDDQRFPHGWASMIFLEWDRVNETEPFWKLGVGVVSRLELRKMFTLRVKTENYLSLQLPSFLYS